jgi:hypothetical protein
MVMMTWRQNRKHWGLKTWEQAGTTVAAPCVSAPHSWETMLSCATTTTRIAQFQQHCFGQTGHSVQVNHLHSDKGFAFSSIADFEPPRRVVRTAWLQEKLVQVRQSSTSSGLKMSIRRFSVACQRSHHAAPKTLFAYSHSDLRPP